MNTFLKTLFVTLQLIVIYEAAVYHHERETLKAGNRKGRITNGNEGIKMQNLDYAVLNITFQQQSQLCGGFLFWNEFVVTAASCVVDPVEGTATIVNTTFPQMTKNGTNIPMKRIIVHPTYTAYNAANNLAIIQLKNSITYDNKTVWGADIAAMFMNVNNSMADWYAGQNLRYCGFGSTLNYPTGPPKALRCTDMTVIPILNCTYGSTSFASTVAGTYCTAWPDRDNNICNGDYGGPLWRINYTPDGNYTSQYPVGVAAFSSDYRSGASCQDGHKVVHTQLMNAATLWPMLSTLNMTAHNFNFGANFVLPAQPAA